jgi:hypothetical protein
MPHHDLLNGPCQGSLPPRQAAGQNDATAQAIWGGCCYRGEGVEKDHAEAHARSCWTVNGDVVGVKPEKFHYGLEKKMSPPQIAAAQKRAKEWRLPIAAQLRSGWR